MKSEAVAIYNLASTARNFILFSIKSKNVRECQSALVDKGRLITFCWVPGYHGKLILEEISIYRFEHGDLLIHRQIKKSFISKNINSHFQYVLKIELLIIK